LQRKARIWYGEEPPLHDGTIRPLRVDKRKQHIVKFKDTVIKGWSGTYELALPPPYLELAYYAGLGAKNSQGFGCIELYNEENRQTHRER
jgi:CRISPR-associated endoribonuclease Cas6